MSLEQSKIAFIGSGAMAEAIIKGILVKGLIAPDHITASDPVPARQKVMTETYGVTSTGDNDSAVAGADIVVMSIKPQVFSKVAVGLQGKVAKDALVLSIMAGITSTALQQGLRHDRVVRAMPNTPAQLNMGVTAWMPTTAVTAAQREQTALILSALG
ncbi:MAG: NAD(P)-binding domain-containing protein, partial [Caldilineaceae bacterium]|nr:NAD(P)-binding domain-containing protein [Caldilineaceae bacterium]